MAGFDPDRMWSELRRLDEIRVARRREYSSGRVVRMSGGGWGRVPGTLGFTEHDHTPSLTRLWHLRQALDESGPRARQLIAQRLSGLSLDAVWGVLAQLAKDVALCYGGSVVAGATLGGIVGAALGGVGIVPGALAGGSAGAVVGQWLLAFLGLKALAEGLLDTLPPALRHYERGFRAVWGDRWDEDDDDPYSPGFHDRGDSSFHQVGPAADEFAHGHVLLILALLSLLLAYISRGSGGRAQALQDIAHNPRLGPRMAQWLEENESRLARHPELQPRPAANMQAQAPQGSGSTGARPSSAQPPRRHPEEAPPPRRPEPARMAQKRVPCFKPNDLPQNMVPEFDRQLVGQEMGINDLTVDEYIKGREAFGAGETVRDRGVARQARAEYQDMLAKKIAKELTDQRALSPAEAKSKAAVMAAEKMKTLAALHNPDLVVAGRDAIADFGDRSVNSRIGAQWTKSLNRGEAARVAQLDAAAAKVPESMRATIKMNAKLERCK